MNGSVTDASNGVGPGITVFDIQGNVPNGNVLAYSGSLRLGSAAGASFDLDVSHFLFKDEFSLVYAGVGTAPIGTNIKVAARSVATSAAPEPATLALFGLGVAGAGMIRRRRRLHARPAR